MHMMSERRILGQIDSHSEGETSTSVLTIYYFVDNPLQIVWRWHCVLLKRDKLALQIKSETLFQKNTLTNKARSGDFVVKYRNITIQKYLKEPTLDQTRTSDEWSYIQVVYIQFKIKSWKVKCPYYIWTYILLETVWPYQVFTLFTYLNTT